MKLSYGTEVDEVADGVSADPQIVHDLSFVIWRKGGDRLELDDNLFEDEQIGNVLLLEFSSFVIDRTANRRREPDSLPVSRTEYSRQRRCPFQNEAAPSQVYAIRLSSTWPPMSES